MATPTVFLLALLLLASDLKFGHGQCPWGSYSQDGNSCIYNKECWSFSDCLAGYDCIQTSAGRRCGFCQAGYQKNGDTSWCEDIDECNFWPCQQGTCFNTAGSFGCSCTTGYTGTLCDTDVDECQSSPCPHGNCQNTRGTFYCTCSRGYTGPLCDTDIDECGYISCNQGTCQNTAGSFQCHCNPGYTGTFCNTDVDECKSSPCQHGTCQKTRGSFQCSCSGGYTGPLCDTDFNECDSSPCQHGTCNNTEGSFRCDCSPGYIGTSCNIEAPDLYINSTRPPTATGERLKAMFSSEERYLGPNIIWTCTLEATDCSEVNVTVLLNITHDNSYGLSYFSLPGGRLPGAKGDAFKQAMYTTPFSLELHRVYLSTLKFAYITVSANSSLTMACGRQASASTPTDACNHCKSSPCAENTTCQNIRDDFLCLCPEGFINALDYHTCAETPDFVFDSQGGKQASGLEVRAMFSTASPAPEARQNWTCVVEAVNCSREEVTLQFNVSKGYKASSFVSFSGDVSTNESMSTENATLQGSFAHYIENRGKTPLYFMVGAARPVYVVLQAFRTLTAICGSNSQPAVPSSRCLSALAALSSSSVPTYAIVGGVAALVIIVIIIVAIVIIRRKRKAAEGNGKTDTHVSFSGLMSSDGQPENGSTAGAPDGTPLYQNQRPLPSRLTSDTRAASVQAATRSTNARGGNQSGIAAPGVPAPRQTSQPGGTPLYQNQRPLPSRLTSDTRAASVQGATRSTNARGGNQSGIAAPDVAAPRQTSRPMPAGGDAPYSHLGEADRANDRGYEDLTTCTRRDVTNGGYEAVPTHSLRVDGVNDDDAAEGGYSYIHPDQVEGLEGQGSCYERVDMDYANSAFSK